MTQYNGRPFGDGFFNDSPMKTIVFARHAKSDWTRDLPDRKRPLNPRGLKDAPMMGRLLRAYEFQPDAILSSPAVRALTTAELVAQELEQAPAIDVREEIYDGGPGGILGLIQELPENIHSVMVFGHNPTTETLIQFCLQMRSGVTVPTGGMACIEFAGRCAQLNPALSSLQWFLIPKLVKRFEK